MSDREALDAALENGDPYPSNYTKHDFALLVAAARERLAQLPEKCTTRHYYDGPHRDDCPSCHGSGKVYPAELVERIGAIVAQAAIRFRPQVMPGSFDSAAVAVLDALNGETPGERAGRLHRQFKDQPGDLP